MSRRVVRLLLLTLAAAPFLVSTAEAATDGDAAEPPAGVHAGHDHSEGEPTRLGVRS